MNSKREFLENSETKLQVQVKSLKFSEILVVLYDREEFQVYKLNSY